MAMPYQEAVLLDAVTANGDGTPYAEVAGFVGLTTVRVLNTGSGTCTIAFEGAFDAGFAGSVFSIGLYREDGQTTRTLATSFDLAATGDEGAGDQPLLRLADTYYPYVRAVLSSKSGTIGVTATLRAYAHD